MLHRIKIPKRASAHQIEIFVERIEQLFNSMDPSPFHEKDLDHDAEEFIVSWAQEFPRHDPVSLIVHVKQAHEPARKIVTEAVHHYFEYRAKLNRLELHHLLQQGRTSLLIGLAFLGACLLLNQLGSRLPLGALGSVMHESLIIAGWVAMWRPMQIFLYDWWPLSRRGNLFAKLGHMRIEVRTAKTIIH